MEAQRGVDVLVFMRPPAAGCSSFTGLSPMGISASFRPVGRRRCEQRPSKQWVKRSALAVAATTERSPPAPARGSWQFHRFGACLAPSAFESRMTRPQMSYFLTPPLAPPASCLGNDARISKPAAMQIQLSATLKDGQAYWWM